MLEIVWEVCRRGVVKGRSKAKRPVIPTLPSSFLLSLGPTVPELILEPFAATKVDGVF